MAREASLGYRIHRSLWRENPCDPSLDPDLAVGIGCGRCPIDALDRTQSSESGQLVRWALELTVKLALEETAA